MCNMQHALVYTFHPYVMLLFGLMFWTRLACAMGLAEQLQFQPQRQPFWNQCVKNIMDIEDFMARTKVIPSRAEAALTSRIAQGGLQGINQLAHVVSQYNHAVPDQLLRHFSDTIDLLPTLQTTAYRGLTLPQGTFESLQVNDSLYEPGFFHAHASLNDAHYSIIPYPTDAESYILRIRTRTSKKPAARFFIQSRDDFLWSAKRHFKIINKAQQPGSPLHFLDVVEITQQEAEALNRMRYIKNGDHVILRCAPATVPTTP